VECMVPRALKRLRKRPSVGLVHRIALKVFQRYRKFKSLTGRQSGTHFDTGEGGEPKLLRTGVQPGAG